MASVRQYDAPIVFGIISESTRIKSVSRAEISPKYSCPNIFTGGLCCHGPFECLPVASLHKSYAVVEALVKNMPKLDAL